MCAQAPSTVNVLPGKLFEYIGVRQPIVAVCPTDLDMASLLMEHADVRLVAPDAVDTITAPLEHLLDEHGGGLIQEPRVSESVTPPVRRSERAKRLAAIFEKAIDGAARRQAKRSGYCRSGAENGGSSPISPADVDIATTGLLPGAASPGCTID